MSVRLCTGLAVALLLPAPGSAGASSMRCAGGVVSHGDTLDEVFARCGEPDHRTRRQRELRSRVGPGIRVEDVDTWTYRRGYGKFVLILTFEGERLQRIDRGPRQETLQ